jgi:hypothetical protein
MRSLGRQFGRLWAAYAVSTFVRDKVSQQLARSSYFYRIIEARELLEAN